MTSADSNGVAIVTGAQQGIGAACAASLAAAGYDVVINFLDDEAGAQVAAQGVQHHGRQALQLRGDVRDAACLDALVDAAASLGSLRVLVNNAAIFPRKPFLEMQDDDWDAVMEVNLRAVFRLTRRVSSHMVDTGLAGAIVNLSSGAAYRGSPRGAHYVSAKAGIVGFTRAAAQELARYRIRVNAVAPGLTDTAQPRFGMSEDEIAVAAELVPLGRIASAEDIADAVTFLCSDGARHITGQVLHVNGGQYLG